MLPAEPKWLQRKGRACLISSHGATAMLRGLSGFAHRGAGGSGRLCRGGCVGWRSHRACRLVRLPSAAGMVPVSWLPSSRLRSARGRIQC